MQVEILHSMLRAKITPSTKARDIHEMAHLLSAWTFQTDFVEEFVPAYSHTTSALNLLTIVGKAAEEIVNIFTSVRQHLGESAAVDRPNSTMKVCRKLLAMYFLNLFLPPIYK